MSCICAILHIIFASFIPTMYFICMVTTLLILLTTINFYCDFAVNFLHRCTSKRFLRAFSFFPAFVDLLWYKRTFCHTKLCSVLFKTVRANRLYRITNDGWSAKERVLNKLLYLMLHIHMQLAAWGSCCTCVIAWFLLTKIGVFTKKKESIQLWNFPRKVQNFEKI